MDEGASVFALFRLLAWVGRRIYNEKQKNFRRVQELIESFDFSTAVKYLHVKKRYFLNDKTIFYLFWINFWENSSHGSVEFKFFEKIHPNNFTFALKKDNHYFLFFFIYKQVKAHDL